jgi:hypothetical protein
MKKGKSYIIQVPGGSQLIAKFIKSENKFYVLKFDKCEWLLYSNRTKKISISRFETGIACMEGTDHLILKEIV